MPSPATDEVIVARKLTKDFGQRRAVDGLDLTVRRGEVFGFLGPNGAGKSTTIRMLVGLIKPTGGEATVAGHSVQRDRRHALSKIGAIVDAPCFYDHLPGRMNLALAQRLHGAPDPERVEEVLGLVALAERGDDPVSDYSHGMRQRLGIARALLHRPEVVILDEPSDGLDPQGRRQMRDIVRGIADRLSITVFISSHLLNEMEVLCDRVAILHEGKRLFEGTVAELRGGRRLVRVRCERSDEAARTLSGLPEVAKVESAAPSPQAREGALQVELREGARVPAIARALAAAGLDLDELTPYEEPLEEAFLRLTGGGAAC